MLYLKKTLTIIFSLSLVILTGCAQLVQVQHDSNKHDDTNIYSSGINTKVLVQPIASRYKEVHVQSGLVVVGLLNSWKVDLDEVIAPAVKDIFSTTYQQVELGNSCDDCGLVVRPKILAVKVNKISMQAHVELEIAIYDAYNREVAHINSKGSSAYLDSIRLGTGVAGYFVPLLGTVIGSSVVGNTVSEALDNALSNFHEELSFQANNGVLARTWLPKSNVRKHKIGKHQYGAEQVAKNLGCDLNSDGVTLNSEYYHQETYSAQCWGKPEFTITCADGRCALNGSDNQIGQQLK